MDENISPRMREDEPIECNIASENIESSVNNSINIIGATTYKDKTNVMQPSENNENDAQTIISHSSAANDIVSEMEETDNRRQSDCGAENAIDLDETERQLEMSLFSEMSVVPENVLDNLTFGVLANFLPDLQKSRTSLKNISEAQRNLMETAHQENSRFGACQALTDISEVMERAKIYHVKLMAMKKEMITLREKSAKLKKRALVIKQLKEKECLQRQQERDLELERERQLTAKVSAKKTAPSNQPL